MTFNPDVTKQAHEVIFLRKSIKTNHLPIFFNDIPVARRLSKASWYISLTAKMVQTFVHIFYDQKHGVPKYLNHLDIIRLIQMM